MDNTKKGMRIIFIALLVNTLGFALITADLMDSFIFVIGLLLLLPMGAIMMLINERARVRKIKKRQRPMKLAKAMHLKIKEDEG